MRRYEQKSSLKGQLHDPLGCKTRQCSDPVRHVKNTTFSNPKPQAGQLLVEEAPRYQTHRSARHGAAWATVERQPGRWKDNYRLVAFKPS